MSGGSNSATPDLGAAVSAEADAAAFDRLPEPLREQLRAVAYDVDAESVELALNAERRRRPCEAAAICATAAGLERFLERVGPQMERRA